jgi:hypothetical protein
MRRNNAVSEHAGRFVAVFDSRKRKLRGLWKRGTRYYAQMRIDTGDVRTKPKRIPLDAKTLDEATAELERTRLSQGVTARTVNIETVTFYAVLSLRWIVE